MSVKDRADLRAGSWLYLRIKEGVLSDYSDTFILEYLWSYPLFEDGAITYPDSCHYLSAIR